MRTIQLTIAALLMSVIAHAQGVRFEQGLSWEQVKAKAKAEHKYIFLDVFATWCGPCKQMDNKIYTSEKVGDYLNKNFISIKVQSDKTNNDNDNVKSWYSDAEAINKEYKISILPTFLFFSPEGDLVHMDVGFMEEHDFMTTLADAIDPNKQYFTLLQKYEQGNADSSLMCNLITKTRKLNDNKTANRIAGDYISTYMDRLQEETFFTKKNLDFLTSMSGALTSRNRAFRLIYSQPDKTDKLLGQKWAYAEIKYIISKEEINSKLWKGENPINNNPDWNKISDIITKKYNKNYAEQTVLDAQIRWYEKKEDWPKDIKYNVKKIEKYGVDTSIWGSVFLNNMIFSVIFQHSNDKKVLNKSMKWMQIILDKTPDSATDMDTYANLLYKVGRLSEALAMEEKALALDKEAALKQKGNPDPVYQETINRMKKGEPTWEQSYNQ